MWILLIILLKCNRFGFVHSRVFLPFYYTLVCKTVVSFMGSEINLLKQCGQLNFQVKMKKKDQTDWSLFFSFWSIWPIIIDGTPPFVAARPYYQQHTNEPIIFPLIQADYTVLPPLSHSAKNQNFCRRALVVTMSVLADCLHYECRDWVIR